MALQKCKECGKDVSTTAPSCPHCGHVRTAKRSGLARLGIGVLILGALGTVGSHLGGTKPLDNNVAASASVAGPPLHQEGEPVSVGYMGYAVWRSWWSQRLGGGFTDEPPNAKYLFVAVSVVNADTKARIVPPFKLIDENGSEYEADLKGYLVPGSIGLIESLNPSVSKVGFVVFDVPPDKTYRLDLSGGYWSADHAYIRLQPAPSMPKNPLDRLERYARLNKESVARQSP